MGTFALLPQVVAAVHPTPVIAAGGIANAAGVSAALALGASAVQVGTAFLLCEEASIGAFHERALRGEDPECDPAVTAVTNLFSGRPARGIVNHVMRVLGPMAAGAPVFPLAPGPLAPFRTEAETQFNSSDFTPMWAGANTSGCSAVPAEQKVRELTDGVSLERWLPA